MAKWRRMRWCALQAAACVFGLGTLPMPAWADPAQLPTPCDDTAWSGSIGPVPVHIAFDIDVPGHGLAGRSYYRASLEDLVLVREADQPDTWRERDGGGGTTGTLSVSCNGDELRGTWTSVDGKRSLPVTARKILNSAYSQARLAALRPQAVRATFAEARAYENLKAPPLLVDGLRLLGSGPALERINADLMTQFRQQVESDLECTPGNRVQSDFRDRDRAMEMSWRVLDWNERFVIVEGSAGGYCAPAAHPYGSSWTTVYGAGSGERLDPRTWLLPELRKNIDPESRFGQFLTDTYRRAEHGDEKELENCLPGLSLEHFDMTPRRDGVLFSFSGFSYAMTPCEASAVVPYRKVAPFLSAEGREVMEFYQPRR